MPLRIVDAAGQLLFDAAADRPRGEDPLPALKAYWSGPSRGIGTLTVPNTSAALALVDGQGLAAGTWSMIVSDRAYECASRTEVCCSGGSTTSTYDVTVLTKAAAAGETSRIPDSGTIDLEFWFATRIADLPGGSPRPIAASTAPTDSDFQRMLLTLKTILRNGAQITVGTVTYQDAPQDVLTRYARGLTLDGTGGCSDAADLFRLAMNGNAINVFLVSSVSGGGLAPGAIPDAVGGLPGPATFPGTGGSGIAVSTVDLRGTGYCGASLAVTTCGADKTAYIIAHEIGHYLGLYHVTEADGTSFDPLSDTPRCPCSYCAPAMARRSCADAVPPPSAPPHPMSISECQGTLCGGGGNLMFYAVGQGSKGTLTPEQQRVMRANPLVR